MRDICVKNLTCSYEQKTIFDNFDVTFEQGKINVILGGSGVGKTTLLNAIAGIKSYEGQIEGCEGGVSYIFQKDRLIPSISVYNNLDLILKGVVKGGVWLRRAHKGFGERSFPSRTKYAMPPGRAHSTGNGV